MTISNRSTGHLVTAVNWNELVDVVNDLSTDVIAAEADIATIQAAGTEGTWTPAFTGSGGGSGQSYSLQEGVWVRRGNGVQCWGVIALTAKGTITGNLMVTGFPIAPQNVGSQETVFPVRFVNLATNWVGVYCRPIPATTTANIVGNQAAATTNGTPLTTTDMGNTSSMRIYVAYKVT